MSEISNTNEIEKVQVCSSWSIGSENMVCCSVGRNAFITNAVNRLKPYSAGVGLLINTKEILSDYLIRISCILARDVKPYQVFAGFDGGNTVIDRGAVYQIGGRDNL